MKRLDTTPRFLFSQQQAITLNSVLLGIHVAFFLLFLVLDVTVMLVTNAFSILLYLLLFWLAKRNQVRYLCVAVSEIVLYMCVATFSMGWECGFQLYCFALIPIVFFCDYLGKKMGIRTINPELVSALIAGYYGLLRVLSFALPPLYVLDDKSTEAALYILNTVMIFAFIIVFMANFENLVGRTEERLAEIASMDALTQLRSRRCMQDLLDDTFEACQAGGQQMAVAILDIDDFKLVNDRFGHNAGDYVLRKVSREIRACEAENCVLACRWGGEEFVLLTTGADACEHLNRAVRTLADSIRQQDYWVDGGKVPITVTIGTAQYRSERTVDALIAKADSALYDGKQQGKNRVVAGQ